MGGAALVLLGAKHAIAAKPLIAEDDRRVTAREVSLPAASGMLTAYYALPAGARDKVPGVMLIHESRGRTAYVEDVARRLAVSGYATLAPDFLAPAGGTPTEPAKARELTSDLETDQVTADAVAAYVWLKSRDECSGKVAAVGFAWGGGIALRLAVVAQGLDAAVSFYGKPPPGKDAAQIRAPLLLHKAELDEKGGEDAFEEALRTANHPLESETYPGVEASFHNDTVESRFNATAAQQAWERTLTFLKANLG
jgi:carboxymethylenebutenolidase